MKLAVGYIRVSSYSQLSTARKYKHSFRRQAETINEYANRNEYEVIQYFFDCIKGETLFYDRPGGRLLSEYLEALKDNGLTAMVVVEDMSRFARGLCVVDDPRLSFMPVSASSLSQQFERNIESILSDFFVSSYKRQIAVNMFTNTVHP